MNPLDERRPDRSDRPRALAAAALAADPTPPAFGLSTGSTGGLVGFVTRSVATAKAELTATYGR